MYISPLKSAAAKGILWTALDKFASQIGQFIVGVVLARLLMPEDFGLIGMLAIFIALSQTVIESGLNMGLIQSQERKAIDFSTTFVFNLVISTFFYILLFFTAPYIAAFFRQPQLIDLTRILGLSLFINAFAIVQRTILTIDLDFKSIAKSNVVGVVFGGLFGVIMALNGFGVWSLVVQMIVSSIATSAALWSYGNWKLSFLFSTDSFRTLFGYGSKLLLASLYAQTLNNIYNICIGRFYPSTALGYYTRAKTFADVSAGTIGTILQQTTFPIFTLIQTDRKRLVSVYSRMIKMAAFCTIPLMTFIALLAKPIVILLLTDKWVALIPLLQWMVFARVLLPMSAINMNVLNAIGRSDLYLKVDLCKLPMTVIALVITIPLGVKAMIIGHVMTSAISFIINAYLPGKLFGYGAIKQFKDMIPVLIATCGMAVLIVLIQMITEGLLLQLLLSGVFGLITYLGICRLLQVEEVFELRQLLLNFKKKVYD
ncbi:lipopolysaccharide biosynthesis protein, partial [Flavobacterium sp.]|uniref:lipopolysaccharide biosynthesis protein n=1 Tax=Flavobacterium sp. TaxID=239 RepID=UPI0026035650